MEPFHPTQMRGMFVGQGPGSRRSNCDICIEQIESTEAVVTHDACDNTFHMSCFGEWVASNQRQGLPTTCPMCRVQLTGILEDSEWEDFASIQEASASQYIHPPPFNDESLATARAQMYEYEMLGDEFPTPALIHLFDTQGDAGIRWMGDYLSRQMQAQSLSPAEAANRLRTALVVLDNVDMDYRLSVLEDELQEDGEWATDFEVVENSGRRRPRRYLVNYFQVNPTRARDWLHDRIERTQHELNLDDVTMHEFTATILESVRREIERQEADV